MNTNKKKFFFTTMLILITMLIISRLAAETVSAAYRMFYNSKFFPPVVPLIPRISDNFGKGNFGASRDGGSRKHKGQDYKTTPGQSIFAPISGTLYANYAYANKSHPTLKMLKIVDGATAVNIMYAVTLMASGARVEKGQVIGKAQSLQGVYPGITDHVHVEVAISGVKVDPVPFFEPVNEIA